MVPSALFFCLVAYALITERPPKIRQDNAKQLLLSTSSVASATQTAKPPATPASGPRLNLASTTYNFGKVTGDTKILCEFVFTNTGNEPLIISNVIPSCGCMTAKPWTQQVAPGQKGSVPIEFNTAHYLGRVAKSATVICNDPVRSNLSLQITGDVWRPLQITPELANFNLNVETPSNSVTVRLASQLDEPLYFTELLNTNANIAAELQTNVPGKEYSLVLRTIPPFPTNNQSGEIQLKSSSPIIPTVPIKTRINIYPTVLTIPYVIRMPSLPLAQEFPYNVWVRNLGTTKVQVTEAKFDSPSVAVNVKEQKPGTESVVELKFPTGFNVTNTPAPALHIKTTHPRFPELTVPLLLTR